MNYFLLNYFVVNYFLINYFLAHYFLMEQVSDFGLALPFDSTYQSGGKIPIKWTAPEAVKEGVSVESYTIKRRVYVFVCLFVLSVG